MAEKDLLDRRLLPFLSRARIDCDLFAYKCPLSWGSLARTRQRNVRRCGECGRDVFLVTNEAELIERATKSQCVAVIRSEELPDPKTLKINYDDRDYEADEYEEGEYDGEAVMGELE